ncbi:MAG: 2-(1,2-epoxy-1,2-dihydrophenyl)acetyl-CoA isomerase [Alphaproteobacteria bacterium]|nr:2-(1,2-epoxy-1,2-dihydrophenyl)acetyl-CoA isomerase [Alphaproteobacteria bacterium]
MSYQNVLLEIADGVARLTLNRPQSLNSLNKALIDDIRAALRALGKNESVRAVIVTGAGRGFCAGADLAGNDFGDGVQRSVGEGVSHSMEIAYNPLVRELAGFPKPVVAAVNGVAAGGGVGLALCCDIVLAAKSASFVQVFGPRLGLVPDMGCTWFLPQLVGRARARALAMLGDKLSAEKAAEWGLIWAAVDDDKLMSDAETLAARLAKGPALAFSEIKRALDAAAFNSLDEQLEYERTIQKRLGDSEDFREGVTAFLTKREPKFKSK